MTTEEITYETQGHIGIITIDRPEARNALTARTYAEIAEAVDTTEARCLVITGRDPAFCSGDDVKSLMRDSGQAGRLVHASPTAADPHRAGSLLRTDVPVIAAVNGAAVGWGMELALMADIRIASEHARFGELFVKRGLCCDVAGLGRLAQVAGREVASELLFTGRIVDAEVALGMRLVSRLVAHDDLMPTALGLAEEIAANPPLAVRQLKAGLRRALDPDWDDLGRWVSATLLDLFRTEDHREGVAAFLEKREPRYVGR